MTTNARCFVLLYMLVIESLAEVGRVVIIYKRRVFLQMMAVSF